MFLLFSERLFEVRTTMISTFYEKIVGSPQQEPNDPKILCVGKMVLDIVQLCKEFPKEDTEER